MRAAQPPSSSKSAVTGLVRSLARDHGPDNVRVNALSQNPKKPQGTVLVTVSQIDPIGVSFALPERELGHGDYLFIGRKLLRVELNTN